MLSNLEKWESAQNKASKSGSILEADMIGTANSKNYKEAAYATLYPERCGLDNLGTDERFEKILKIREDAQAEFQDIQSFNKKFVPLDKAMALVEKCQVGNPENPSRFFAHELYQAVKDRFVSDKYILKFFSATGGTHLDVSHGIDCYFKLYDKESGKELTRATIDLTQNSKKDRTRADVLIYISDDDYEKLDGSKNNDRFDPEFLKKVIAEETEKITDAMVENFQRNKK
ncbi:MAG: hypothetical protein HY931_03765 [Candidatus Falkowbacteria bacterium]|nr:MAG: hypothetical protein HY931_03765 [Candidatus Falkowbacteria bacterium]